MNKQVELKMKLSPDQEEALSNIKLLLTDTHREQVLTGSPGTGKSYLTAMVIQLARKARYEVVLAATTHAASKVMADFTQSKVVTLHKLLDLKVLNAYQTNTVETVQSITKKGPYINQLVRRNSPTLLIIDEASYIDEEMYGYISDMLTRQKSIVILYVGDADQLPPIGSDQPYIFTLDKPTSTLTTDHRFAADSQMASIVTTLKTNIQTENYLLTDIVEGKEITLLDAPAFKQKMLELYLTDEYKADPYYVKSIAFRNTVVDKMNMYIRSSFYDSPEYQVGERLVVNSALIRKRKLLANNGDVVTVLRNTATELNGITGQNLHLQNGLDSFYAIVTNQKVQKNKERKRLAKLSFPQLYQFMESFIDVKSIYSSTIHKAQGASYTNVMLNLDDLVECTDHVILARLLLVAVSRAREHVYVYGTVPSHLMKRAS